VRIDLHTHSDRSDGTDPPRELVAKAAAAGIGVLALTDHDTASGWQEAVAAAEHLGIGLVPGMEISCIYAGAGVHLLAYLPDPTYAPLDRELRRVLDGRSARLPATLDRLREIGIEISAADLRRAAGPTEAMGRPHVADVLVDKGVVAHRDEAFDRFLSYGRPAYVDRYAADLVTTLALVAQAGGATVLAHPWGRRNRRVITPQLLAELRGFGLNGLEVDHQDHDTATRAELRGIARELGLVVTGSSDYHGEGKLDCPLGCNTTARHQLERLLSAARAAADAAGRGTDPVMP
jgi:predicted metal-dependent phosphoesterase TrpH